MGHSCSLINQPTAKAVMATGTINSNMVLLWTGTTTESFGPQTISLDLSSYAFVDIVYSPWGGTGELAVQRFVVGANSELSYTKTSNDDASDAQHFLNGTYRTVNVTTTGVTFGAGSMIYAGGAYQPWNNRAIPYKIYGIK